MNKIKSNRIVSFIIVALVYALAVVTGVLVFNALNLRWWLSLFIADVVATIVTFIFSVIFQNASVYDPYWSVQPPIILIAFAIGKKLTVLGVILMIIVSLWAIRLTANWAYTFKNLNHQDWRYTMLKEKTGKLYPLINFIGIHMVPTVIVYACILPAVYVVVRDIAFNPISIIFMTISLLSIIVQGIADCEMHAFRKNKSGTFIRVGLWKYSRHPNYLGEICMWWGVALSVVVSIPNKWFLIFGAFINTLLFLFVSIPMADARQSRKEGFLEYKRQTRTLLPIKKISK